MESTLEEFREEKDEAFKNASWSPLTEEQKSGFRGLNYYPENQNLVFHDILIEPAGNNETVETPTSAGDTEKYSRAGIIKFSLEGKEYQIHLYKDIDGSNYFLPIKDATSGSETYKDGRYVDIEVDDNKQSLRSSSSKDSTAGLKIPKLDFNYAYNPYCAYSHNWRCPISPEENRLPIAIEAGEKNFNGQ